MLFKTQICKVYNKLRITVVIHVECSIIFDLYSSQYRLFTFLIILALFLPTSHLRPLFLN